MSEIYEGPEGVQLEIDDTDHDTPAVVILGRKTSTYDCALATGEVDGCLRLSAGQMRWLEQHSYEVDEAFQTARASRKEYE